MPGEVGYLSASSTVADARGGRHNTLLANRRPPKALPGLCRGQADGVRGRSPPTRSIPRSARSTQQVQSSPIGAEFWPETKRAMAFGAPRCGFLGLLHMEIVQERLERETT